jgi:acyl-CoA synthetase (AMP-forming)/AMP-acid ligase II
VLGGCSGRRFAPPLIRLARAPYHGESRAGRATARGRMREENAMPAARESWASAERTAGAFARERAQRLGDAPALVHEQQTLSYRALDERSRALARGLLASGLGKGARVGVLLPNGPDWAIAWLAAARIGALVVPINTFLQARELAFALRHADVSLLLTTARFLGNDYLERLERAAPELAAQRGAPLRVASLPFLREVRVWEGAGGERPWTSPGAGALEALGRDVDDALLLSAEAEVSPADPLVCIYTSGSTGDPKGAIHGHGAAFEHAARLNAYRQLGPGERMYSPMPFFWVGGFVYSLLCTLQAGSCLLTEEAFEPGRTLAMLERERATIVAGWPHYGAALAQHPDFEKRDLRSVRSGNLYAVLPPDRRPKDPALRAAGLGMTETLGPHTLGDADEDLPERLRGCFGRAVPGAEHKVVDPETGAVLPPGAPGEICVRGPFLMQGLMKRTRAETFDADGFYHTGDRGFFDAEGQLFFLGRLGELIKTGGANVTPREVEAALEAQPEVSAAHVVGVPHAERGEVVAAAVVLRDGASADAEALRERLRGELAAYKLPRHVLLLSGDELPMTASGKLDRRRLRAELERRIAARDDGRA